MPTFGIPLLLLGSQPFQFGATMDAVVFLQDACLDHQYIRSRDTSQIVERPERLRAVKVGLAATISRLEELAPAPALDELTAALDRMNLGSSSAPPPRTAIQIVHSSATVNLLDNPAVTFIHGDIDGDVYLENLVQWATKSAENIAKGESEIPEGLSQTDLYRELSLSNSKSVTTQKRPVCPSSLQAINGAIGTVCEAVDTVVKGDASRAFCAIRPPGHHCGEDSPCGFCFVNNVAVGAAHGAQVWLRFIVW